MKNHPVYKKVKQYALDNMATVDFEAMPAGEIIMAAGAEGTVSGTFAANMKRAVLMALQNRDDENRIKVLKAGVKGFMDTNFPDWQAEKGREDNLPFIKIWPRGKP
jgi:hypothetical protein